MAATSSTPVIDFSAHVDLGGSGEYRLARVVRDTEGPIFHDFDAARERFSAGDLDGVVLSQPSHFGSDDVTATSEGNDGLLDHVEPHANYYALAALPSGAGGEAAAAELERCLENGFNGGVVRSWAHQGAEATDRLEPVFEVASEYGAPLLLHPKVSRSLAPTVFDDEHRSNAVFGRNAALSNSVYLLIHRGYLDRYPDLSVVVHHMGGDLPGLLGQVRAVIDRAERDAESAEARSVALKPFEEFEAQFLEHVYLDTVGFHGDFSSHPTPLDWIPADNIVFGSDWPCEARTAEDFHRHVRSIREVVSGDAAGRILGGNALDLLVNT